MPKADSEPMLRARKASTPGRITMMMARAASLDRPSAPINSASKGNLRATAAFAI